eukprot:tig00000691_g3189.t1
MKVSVWFMPPAGEVQDRLRELMGEMRDAHGGPTFAPHITWLGSIETSQKMNEYDIAEKLKTICQRIPPQEIKLTAVKRQGEFFRCVLAEVDPTEPLVNAYKGIWKSFYGSLPAPEFYPHLSLLYGELSDEEKEGIVQRYASDARVVDVSFTVTTAEMWDTSHGCDKWVKITSIPLEGKP